MNSWGLFSVKGSKTTAHRLKPPGSQERRDAATGWDTRSVSAETQQFSRTVCTRQRRSEVPGASCVYSYRGSRLHSAPARFSAGNTCVMGCDKPTAEAGGHW